MTPLLLGFFAMNSPNRIASCLIGSRCFPVYFRAASLFFVILNFLSLFIAFLDISVASVFDVLAVFRGGLQLCRNQDWPSIRLGAFT